MNCAPIGIDGWVQSREHSHARRYARSTLYEPASLRSKARTDALPPYVETLALLGGPPAITEELPPHSVLGDAEYEAVATVIRSGDLSEGRREGQIADFEDALCDCFDVAYALSFCSGIGELDILARTEQQGALPHV